MSRVRRSAKTVVLEFTQSAIAQLSRPMPDTGDTNELLREVDRRNRLKVQLSAFREIALSLNWNDIAQRIDRTI